MMPWFPGDFMRSTRGWSVTAKGVYRELLDAQWDMGELPADVEDLRLTINATIAEWTVGWKKCADKFPLIGSSRRNVRLEAHRSKSEQIASKRSAIGKLGGQASAEAKLNQRSTDGQPIAQANVNHPVQSTPIQSNPGQTKPINGVGEECRPAIQPIEFSDIKSLYPSRAGNNPWPRALKACMARIREGSTWSELTEGVRRYQVYCRETKKLDTEYVLQAATFFGPDKQFLEPWYTPKNKAEIQLDSNIGASQEWLRNQEILDATH
jgi:uncharacterized protein YdaU (DUF1376 family)